MDAVTENTARNTRVYSWVMEFTTRERDAPSVADVAEGTGIGVLAVAEAIGELNWLFLNGSATDPAHCFVEIDGE